MNETLPAVLLIGAGIELIVGLWTPDAGTLVALTEVWKMVMLPGDRGVGCYWEPLVARSQC